MSISGERCRPYEVDLPRLTPSEEIELMQYVAKWEILDDGITRRLSRSFPFENWMPAIQFASLIAEQAEFEDHHPLFTITWGRVTVTWWTHIISGLHRNDFVMACRTNHIYDDFRPGS